MKVIGEVRDIIYRNETNSYTIAEFETEEESTTIVGYLPFINAGDTLEAEGKFVEHKEYGRQFKVDTFEKKMPQTSEAIQQYLANGNIKGVGEALAKRIVNRFGEETIKIIKERPFLLAEIRGISENKAKEISESFIENWEVWQIVGFLDKFGIGVENAKKVYELYGTSAIEQIESNPYLLIDLATGIDFKQIDKMALEIGISYDNDKRIESGIKYALIRSTYNGHACVIEENLIEFVRTLLDVATENIEDGIINLKLKDEIRVEKRENANYIYLAQFFDVEEEIAIRIQRLKESKNIKKISNIKSELKKIEKISEINPLTGKAIGERKHILIPPASQYVTSKDKLDKAIGTIEEAIKDIKEGKVILVIDDPDRENEGDLVCAAEFATTENVNFMASYAKGLICMPMEEELCEKLNLEQMVKVNTDNHCTAFTVSIDQIIVKNPTITTSEPVIASDEIKVNNKLVLVVDDNKINLKVAERLLETYGITTECVESGFICIDNLKNGKKYDLILMDDMMPKLSGVETLHKIKEQIPDFNIPTVALTANALTGMREKYLADGFDDYLAKPISKDELNRVIHEYLNKE